jgi:DNA-directed RNA polymerase I, II, and III subunit RPABC2
MSSVPVSFEIKSMDNGDILKAKKPSSSQIKKTSSIMTKYEYVRLIQGRSTEIAAGFPIFIEIGDNYEPTELAKLELHARVIPLVIVRLLTDGTTEVWNVKDMSIRDY